MKRQIQLTPEEKLIVEKKGWSIDIHGFDRGNVIFIDTISSWVMYYLEGMPFDKNKREEYVVLFLREIIIPETHIEILINFKSLFLNQRDRMKLLSKM